MVVSISQKPGPSIDVRFEACPHDYRLQDCVIIRIERHIGGFQRRVDLRSFDGHWHRRSIQGLVAPLRQFLPCPFRLLLLPCPFRMLLLLLLRRMLLLLRRMLLLLLCRMLLLLLRLLLLLCRMHRRRLWVLVRRPLRQIGLQRPERGPRRRGRCECRPFTLKTLRCYRCLHAASVADWRKEFYEILRVEEQKDVDGQDHLLQQRRSIPDRARDIGRGRDPGNSA